MIGRVPGTEQPDSSVRAWAETLDALENDVTVAERMIIGSPLDQELHDAPAGDWMPPQASDLLPDDLVARARELLRRQVAAREGLARALEQSRSGLAQLRRGAGELSAPAYIDVTA